MMDGDISIFMIASQLTRVNNIVGQLCLTVPSLLPACWRSEKHSDLISASFVLRPNKESTLKENLGCIFIVCDGERKAPSHVTAEADTEAGD